LLGALPIWAFRSGHRDEPQPGRSDRRHPDRSQAAAADRSGRCVRVQCLCGSHPSPFRAPGHSARVRHASECGLMPLKTMEGRSEMKVKVEFKGTRAEIALSNGPLNLVTRALLRDLDRALGEVNSQADIRCLIVHGGSARAFCAGSDIKEFGELREDASERKILYEDMVLRKL